MCNDFLSHQTTDVEENSEYHHDFLENLRYNCRLLGITITRLIYIPGFIALSLGITKMKISQISSIFTMNEYHNIIEKIINAKIQFNLCMKIYKVKNL